MRAIVSTATPPITTWPEGSRRAERGNKRGPLARARSLKFSGTASQSGASGDGCVVLIKILHFECAVTSASARALVVSHLFWRAHTEQFESVGDHRGGGVVEPQAGAVHVFDWLITYWRDAACGVPRVVGGRD